MLALHWWNCATNFLKCKTAMAKDKTAFVCSECGYDSPKWVGRCPSCGRWNTMKEFTVSAEAKPSASSRAAAALGGTGKVRGAVRLAAIDAAAEPRMPMPDAELNRVLGGGLVPGSLTLIGGEPGIGKSTLLLQTALELGCRVLYVSGEESERQIKLRADRIGTPKGDLMLLCETRLDEIFAQIRAVQPDMVVVDSVQTIYCEGLENSPGSVTQIRECAAALLKYAKESAVPVLLVGHITKDGTIAGPKILEHIVDTVLQFEGDRHYLYRILRSIKNRFGPTAELGIYEMRGSGLRSVDNPSELLLTRENAELSGTAVAAALEGFRPFLIETQALVSSAAYGTPQRTVTGFDLRRLNMLLAVLEKRVGFKIMQKDVFLNIAGGLRVSDPAIDLSVIAAVLSSNVDTAIGSDVCMAGEVGLSGEIRPVTRIAQRIAEAEKLGFKRMLVPSGSIKGLEQQPQNMELVPVARVEEALRQLFG